MPADIPTTPPAHPSPILDDAEVAARVLLLAELQAALAAINVRSVIARHHRLVLRYNAPPPLAPSGPTNPTLHIFTPAGTHVTTTDGTTYQLDDGQQPPVTDPAAAAAIICRALPTRSHDGLGPVPPATPQRRTR